MPLQRNKLQDLRAEIDNASSPIRSEIDAIIADGGKTEDKKNFDIAALFSDETKIAMSRPVSLTDVELKIRNAGKWIALKNAAQDSAIEFRDLFTHAMKDSSIDLGGAYIDGLLSQMVTDNVITDPQKSALQNMGAYTVSLASGLSIAKKIHARDVKAARAL